MDPRETIELTARLLATTQVFSIEVLFTGPRYCPKLVTTLKTVQERNQEVQLKKKRICKSACGMFPLLVSLSLGDVLEYKRMDATNQKNTNPHLKSQVRSIPVLFT
jgi:hypothetical protein